jgi:hypothetical protein
VWDGYRKLAVCTRAQVYMHCSSRACSCQAPWAGQKTSSCVCAGGAGAVCAAQCCRQAGRREGGWLGGWEGACIYPEVGSWYWMLAGCPVRWRRQARSLTSTASARPPATAAPGGMWAAQPTGAFNVFCGATGAASPPTAATPIAQHLAAKVTAAPLHGVCRCRSLRSSTDTTAQPQALHSIAPGAASSCQRLCRRQSAPAVPRCPVVQLQAEGKRPAVEQQWGSETSLQDPRPWGLAHAAAPHTLHSKHH